MEIYEMIELHECPLCGGPALLEDECGSGYSVLCVDCGAISATIDFKDEQGRLAAAQKTADLWNAGKVIKPHPGE